MKAKRRLLTEMFCLAEKDRGAALLLTRESPAYFPMFAFQTVDAFRVTSAKSDDLAMCDAVGAPWRKQAGGHSILHRPHVALVAVSTLAYLPVDSLRGLTPSSGSDSPTPTG